MPTEIANTAGVEQLAYRHAIKAALEDEMTADPSVCFFGEDVASAGGVFKTNDGLLEAFGPERVFNTPICENSFIGMAIGMAVTGLRPVVEIMFSDFLPTAADAIVNEMPKFRYMSGGQFSVPVTIRAMGGGTGRFGTQHSATGESWYMGLPGMHVGTASSPGAIYRVLRTAIRSQNPTLVIEHKALFNSKGPVDRTVPAEDGIGRATVLREGRDVTVVATLLMAARARAAAEALAEDGIDVEVVDLEWIRPLDVATVRESVARTGRLVIAEEQHHAGGWGATVISRLAQERLAMKAPPVVVGLAEDMLVPYSPELEDAVIPTAERIAAACRAAIKEG
jgi:acetoin:2,6-dichlorophenolindophenol oxidoreductase subunit beta